MSSIRIKQGCIFVALMVLMIFASSVSAAPAAPVKESYQQPNIIANPTDFSFTIPVKFTNVPSAYKQWKFIVQVRSTSDVVIAQAEKEFEVDSNLTQTFILKFNADPGKNPSQGIKYAVSLAVKTSTGWKGPSEIRDELDWLKCNTNEQKMLPK